VAKEASPAMLAALRTIKENDAIVNNKMVYDKYRGDGPLGRERNLHYIESLSHPGVKFGKIRADVFDKMIKKGFLKEVETEHELDDDLETCVFTYKITNKGYRLK
jgi:hypothetical protein